MLHLEQLSEDAYLLGIKVKQDNIPVKGMDAAYVQSQQETLIVLRRDGTQTEKTCWLAEELGHHNTGPGRILRYQSPADWKAEARARRWAHNRLLSVDAIRTAAVQAAGDIYEIAEALGVTEQFLREAIDDFKARGLWLIDEQTGF